MGSQCPDTQTIQDNSASAVVKMKLVFVGFLLTLMIGDIVGPGNGGGADDDKGPPRNIMMRNRAGNNGGGNDEDKEPPHRRSADDEVHFIKDNGLQRQARQGRQSVLGCMMGCTRELRPVRGEQGGNERLFANKCAFNIERCRAQVQRKPSLVLSSDQSQIHWPTVN